MTAVGGSRIHVGVREGKRNKGKLFVAGGNQQRGGDTKFKPGDTLKKGVRR